MQKYKGIIDYLDFITKQYNIQITINDFTGFLQVDKDLMEAMQPYLIHKNPFCMQIKSDRKLWDRCLSMKRKILSKSEKVKSTYSGMCFCGMEEYIVPIICKDIIIGVICAGEFSTHKKISNYLINKTAKEYSMDISTLMGKFEQSTLESGYGIEFINNILGIIAEYFSNFYSNLIAIHKNPTIKDRQSVSSESYILSHAVEYIKQNYNNNITVEEIAAFCHCSDSYISHIFKKNIKINIKSYINKMRIEHSKVYLINTSDNIAEISNKVGFNDPNYFTSVFKDKCGISPTNFRRRFQIIR